MTILAVILAGLGRATVGGGWLSRGYVYPLCALFSAYLGFGLSWWAIPFAAVAALTFWLGRTDWFNAPYMVLRYGAAPCVLATAYVVVEHMAVGILIWAVACAFLGWLDGRIRIWAREHSWTFRGYVIDSARIAEAVDGAVIIGGIALL